MIMEFHIYDYDFFNLSKLLQKDMPKHMNSMSSDLFLVLVAIFLAGETNQMGIEPLEAKSLVIDRALMADSMSFQVLEIELPLETEEILTTSHVISSISEINTLDDPGLLFYFTYKLEPPSKSVQVCLYLQPTKSLSPTFKIVLDFILVNLPVHYQLQSFNMTNYQEHFMVESNRSYQLIMFLNGFNNLSLSGNITHAYSRGGQMYTIHYMSCEGEQAEMGWVAGKDFLLFTIMIVPYDQIVQKFKIRDPSYSVQYSSDRLYFYGVKGIGSSQLAAGFQQGLNAVTFTVYDTKQENTTYGIVFLGVRNKQFKDFRNQNRGQYLQKLLVGTVLIVVLALSLSLISVRLLSQKFSLNLTSSKKANYSEFVSEISQITDDRKKEESQSGQQEYQDEVEDIVQVIKKEDQSENQPRELA